MLFSLLLSVVVCSAGSLSAKDREVVYKSYKLEAQKKYEKAAKALAPVYSANKKNYFVNMRLGWLFSLVGKNQNALAHYKKAAASKKKSVEALLGQLNIHMINKDYASAISVGKAIQRIDTKNYVGTQRLITAFIANKQFEQAREFSEQMLALYPNDAIFLEQSGYALNKLGRVEKARKVMTKLILVSPSNLEARRFMSSVSE